MDVIADILNAPKDGLSDYQKLFMNLSMKSAILKIPYNGFNKQKAFQINLKN